MTNEFGTWIAETLFNAADASGYTWTGDQLTRQGDALLNSFPRVMTLKHKAELTKAVLKRSHEIARGIVLPA